MRILVAEDDFASRILLDAVLIKWGYEVVAANDGEAAWEILKQETAPSIAIVDWMMPKLSGVELCRLVRQQHRELVPYILMLTAKGQKSDVSSGLDAGADDYLVKPFDLSELGARLRVARRSITLQRELVESRKAVHYQALHDVSTGTLNRGASLSRVSELFASGDKLALALVAVDNHKAIQQQEGAECAEAAVRATVQRLRATVPEAILGRYGADELLLAVPGEDAMTLAERVAAVRSDVGRSAFSESHGVSLRISLSAGVAQWDGASSLELLLCYADTALYAARGHGVEVFDLQVRAS